MPFSPETIARVRQQYADGVPTKQIRAEHDLRGGSLYYCLDGGSRRGRGRLPRIPRRRRVREDAARDRGRKSLIARLWRTADSQVREIEQRLARAEIEPGGRERDARLLAVLVKTLSELTKLDEARLAAGTSGAPTRTHEADDDPVPRDIHEFRRELARRIHAFVASKPGPGVPGDAAG